jgi:hypothetical protein
MPRLKKRRIRATDNFPPEHYQSEFDDLFPPKRPRTRSECVYGPRPCPWVGCRWHFYLDVSRTGAIILNFPDVDPVDMPCSCALDIIESGTTTLENIGVLMNLTRERVRQIELISISKMKQAMKKIT